MARSYSNAVGDVAEEAGRAAGYTDRAVEGAKELAADVANRASAAAKDAFENPERFIRDTRNQVTRYAQEKPLEALAIAAGLAFVVGALWKR
jgi:ElaB/YqjD/DUF883 family membrane-anchored ribosome-binding protein